VSWSATASGTSHEVTKQLRGLEVQGDQRAVDFGHVEAAKEGAFAVIDRCSNTGSLSVSLSGHITDEDNYSVQVSVSHSKAVG
jgi:hypothetical protein